jgi:hypothetical protein
MSGNWYQAHFWGPIWVSQELFSKIFLRWRGFCQDFEQAFTPKPKFCQGFDQA